MPEKGHFATQGVKILEVDKLRRRSVLVSTLLFLALLLAGCQSENEIMMDDVSDIKAISISKAKVYGKISDKSAMTFENSKELDTFKKAFSNAKREKVKPEGVNYDLMITDDKGDNYLLQFYLGEEKSAFFYIGYEDKVYFTTEEVTQELRKIIKP